MEKYKLNIKLIDSTLHEVGQSSIIILRNLKIIVPIACINSEYYHNWLN